MSAAEAFTGIAEPWKVLDKYRIVCDTTDPDEWEQMLLKAQVSLADVQGKLWCCVRYGGDPMELTTLLKENTVLARYVEYYKDNEPNSDDDVA